MNNRANRTTELAALLDGEIKDHELAEGLHAWIGQDPSFQEEFAAQREVKTLLARLPEHEAPPYLATRVLGAIAARKRHSVGAPWRMWATAIGGFIICLSTAGLWQAAQQMSPSPMLARTAGSGDFRVQPGVSANPDDLYKPPVWSETLASQGPAADPRLADFLRFANDAHNYARAMYAADEVSPDMPAAVLVLDQGSGR